MNLTQARGPWSGASLGRDEPASPFQLHFFYLGDKERPASHDSWRPFPARRWTMRPETVVPPNDDSSCLLSLLCDLFFVMKQISHSEKGMRQMFHLRNYFKANSEWSPSAKDQDASTSHPHKPFPPHFHLPPGPGQSLLASHYSAWFSTVGYGFSVSELYINRIVCLIPSLHFSHALDGM